MVDLLDDDVSSYSLADWRRRNVCLYQRLSALGLIDVRVVSVDAFRALNDALIAFRVGAATDPQNASHVRAQNENVIHYAIAGRVPVHVLTISFVAGCFHDLNKAVGEPLRDDDFAVRDGDGRIVPVMTTMAQIVGLNHLGDRTRRAIVHLTRGRGPVVAPSVGQEIDRCIVHHGLGSSRFIRDLVDGRNAWWGTEFVDPHSGRKKLVHPEQPELTLASLIHDLADSTQQMQGGATWLMKYPSGFWRASGRSYLEMLTSPWAEDMDIPMSLRSQIDVESETCLAMIDRASQAQVVDDTLAETLRAAVGAATRTSRQWVDDSEACLSRADGASVFHDVARDLGVSTEAACALLREAHPGTPDGDVVEEAIWSSARRVERARARALAIQIESSPDCGASSSDIVRI